MKYLIFVVSSLAVATAQFPQVPGVPGFEPTRPVWNGPLANHVNGQLVPETPEVAAAKAQHAQAHAQVLAVLPTLPPEIRYQMTGIVNPVVPQHHNHINNPIVPPFVPQHNQPIHTSPQFTQFAEEIPRSEIGEVPEVHAARVAHLAAFQAAKAALPTLQNTAPQPVGQVQFPQQRFDQNIQDTPEVIAARAAHAQAVAAARNFGK